MEPEPGRRFPFLTRVSKCEPFYECRVLGCGTNGYRFDASGPIIRAKKFCLIVVCTRVGDVRPLSATGIFHFRGRRSTRSFCPTPILTIVEIYHPWCVAGSRGRSYSTSAARDLAVYLLLDSAKIQQSDVKYVNRKRKKQNKKPFTPLYEQEHAVAAIKKFRTIDYEETFEPLPGVKCRFHVAGHMLGAAIVELDLDQESQPPFKLVFSGDIGPPSHADPQRPCDDSGGQHDHHGSNLRQSPASQGRRCEADVAGCGVERVPSGRQADYSSVFRWTDSGNCVPVESPGRRW